MVALSQDKYERRAQALKKAILKAVDNSPTIKGLTVSQTARRLEVPEPTVYSYMERLVAEGILGYTTIGKTKVYLKKN